MTLEHILSGAIIILLSGGIVGLIGMWRAVGIIQTQVSNLVGQQTSIIVALSKLEEKFEKHRESHVDRDDLRRIEASIQQVAWKKEQ